MITVLFTCKGCGLVKAKAFVRYRGGDEDIREWMKEVRFCVGEAHSLLSPRCKVRKADILLPLPEDGVHGRIGGRPKLPVAITTKQPPTGPSPNPTDEASSTEEGP